MAVAITFAAGFGLVGPPVRAGQQDDPLAADEKRPVPPVGGQGAADRQKLLPPKGLAVFHGRRDPKTGKIDGGVEDFKPVASEKENSDEYQAWHLLVSHARQFPAATLQEAARRDFTRDDFINQPRFEARTDLFRLDGKLTKARRIAASKALRGTDTPEVYEALLVPLDEPPNALVSFVFTDLPAGLDPVKQAPLGKDGASPWVDVKSWATVAGYFFKVVQDAPGQTPIPQFIGRTAALLEAEPRPGKNPTALEKGLRVFEYVRDETFAAKAEENWEEVSAWNRVLLHARRFTPEELEAAAAEVKFADLVEDVRRDYKFDLVKFEGRLVRLSKPKATEKLLAAGVDTLYEGWLIPRDEPSGNPVCIYFTDPPEGVEPADRVNKWVSFAGYSFKLHYYKSAETRKDNPNRNVTKKAPLLIGRAVTPRRDPDAPASSLTWGNFMNGVLAVVVGLIVLAGGITLWYRRGDRQAKDEITAHRKRNPFADGSV